jgi:hypothetical protein
MGSINLPYDIESVHIFQHSPLKIFWEIFYSTLAIASFPLTTLPAMAMLVAVSSKEYVRAQGISFALLS